VVGIVVCSSVEADGCLSCPVQVVTLVCEHSIGLSAVSDNEALVGVVLCKTESNIHKSMLINTLVL